MKTIINVECIDQELVITNSPVIASGGTHENIVKFNFDSSWNGYAKMASFYQEKAKVYSAEIDESGCAVIPTEATAKAGILYFGVVGVDAETTKTTKMVKIKIHEGAPTSGSPSTESTISKAVEKWLEEHPEATTTVQDNTIDYDKLTDDLKNNLNRRIKKYYTLMDAKEDSANIPYGTLIQTLGFYSKNDFGGALYEVNDGAGNWQFSLGNGRFATILKQGFANIAQYGAKYGDAESTDTAFQKIIADKIKEIIIPPYTYETSGNIKIPYDCTISGMDKRNSKLVMKNENSCVFDFTNDETALMIELRNFIIWDGTTTVNVNKENTVTNNSTNTAIILGNSICARFEKVKTYGFNLAYDGTINPYSTDWIDCEIHNCNTGINIKNVQAININRCGFDYVRMGISIGTSMGSIFINQCQFENMRDGIYKTETGDLVVENCYFDNNARFDIYVYDGDKLTVANSLFFHKTENAMISYLVTNGQLHLINNVFNNPLSSVSTPFVNCPSPNSKCLLTNNLLKGSAVYPSNIVNLVETVDSGQLHSKINVGSYMGDSSNNNEIELGDYLFQRIGGQSSVTLKVPNIQENNKTFIVMCKIGHGNTITLSGDNFSYDGQHYFRADTKNERVMLVMTKTSKTENNWFIEWFVSN